MQDVFTLFMIIDSDHNGLIDLNEFVTGFELSGRAFVPYSFFMFSLSLSV